MSHLCVPGGEWRERAPSVRDAMGSLVSQLTASPDITKYEAQACALLLPDIRRPQVFLYPYSVLELGAFRALRHQKGLFAIKDIKDPVERLLHVTKWFFSAMERMETMNKKAFNPVLGEELNAWIDDPVYGRTVLKAEQVSHHPPVSAYLLSNKKHGIEFVSNIKFGITFNGNSVSCRLQGKARLFLHTLNEVYDAPNWVPDVILQNVLFGTRRQLWSGDWSLSCAQTGLGVRVSITEENRNDSWFSAVQAGQYANVVEGVVVKLAQPDTPIKLLEGLAGQHVDVIDCATKSKYRLFDAAQLVMETLHFLPPDRRPANESLVVWKSTADALLVDDLATADREKTAVEAHQRELRRQREADGQPFVPQYFHYDDALEAFVPNEGLAERQTAFLEGKR